jgi:hypothetical protein
MRRAPLRTHSIITLNVHYAIFSRATTIITRVHGRIHSLKVVLPIFLMLAAQMAAVRVASMTFARAAP